MSKRIFDMSPRMSHRDFDRFNFTFDREEFLKSFQPDPNRGKLKSAEDFVRGGGGVEVSKLKEIIHEQDEEIKRLRRQLEQK